MTELQRLQNILQVAFYEGRISNPQIKNMRYKVEFYQNELWRVIETDTEKVMVTGSLSDCEAWIRLKEEGYL